MPPIESKILANRLRSIAGELIGLSKNIESNGMTSAAEAMMFVRVGDNDQEVPHDLDPRLADYAEDLYHERRRRNRYFSEHLFAEPAWDMLLDLFVNRVRNRAISITSACIAGGIPATTGLRWLGVLEKEGLLARRISGDDARVTWVHLSEQGMNLMRNYLVDACELRARAEGEKARAIVE